MPAALRTDGLTKYYHRVVGVESLSLEVPGGEVFGFLGANGAGKTTTIRLLLDLLRPTHGTASILGLDCQRQGLEVRRRVGYLPGETPIYPELTGAAYLDFLTKLSRRPVAGGRLRFLLRRFDVSEVDLRRPLRDQSHGMKRKLGLIQALAGEAPVLILDEPTSGLDPLIVEAFRQTIDELKKRGDTTVFLSSHVLAEVESVCDRIAVIRGGRLVTACGLDELRRRSPRRLIVEFASAVNGSFPLEGRPEVHLVERTPMRWVLQVQGPLGAVMSALAGLPVHDVQLEPFRLEDYVLGLYAEGERGSWPS
ncbi:MAG TPA: ABC transporter ATP-binding protein [Vicinamibacteria bacterium]|jgi:ABC-2 type transport system ATP-binding protein|nr:ABC transporter ATP-binding protein [Vicinamibacteria bacterium]